MKLKKKHDHFTFYMNAKIKYPLAFLYIKMLDMFSDSIKEFDSGICPVVTQAMKIHKNCADIQTSGKYILSKTGCKKPLINGKI